MKQTAVEWLEERYNDPLLKDNFISKEEFQKAKAMEKEQIMEAYIIGSYDMAEKEFKPEHYYNETFNS